MANQAGKRPRTSSSSSSLVTSTNLSPSSDPPHKASRIQPGFPTSTPIFAESSAGVPQTTNHPILCNLPPTCNRKPTPISSSNDLERHYAMYHAHVCEVQGCGCVFPEPRLLELHQTECHDPIAALRKERNEKIFQCHLPAPICGKSFLTPKARRLHLVQAHAYPKQYFFAVTNKGIGGLLKKWGEGASLIRKEWKPREAQEKANYREKDENMMDEDEDDDEEEVDDNEDSETRPPLVEDDDEPADLEATPRIGPRRVLSPAHDTSGLAGLTDSLNSLTLVPNSVKFGRGAKARGFAPDTHYRGGPRGRGRGKPQQHSAARSTPHAMAVDRAQHGAP